MKEIRSKTVLLCFSLSLIGVALSGDAAVAPGESIVLNGTMTVDQEVVPQFWRVSGAGDGVAVSPLKEGGRSFIRFRNSGAPRTADLRQGAIRLVEGGRYRLSCLARAKDLKTARASVVVTNERWEQDQDLRLRAVGNDWQPLTVEFTCFASKGLYSVYVYVERFTGTLDVTDVRLEALDEKSRQGSAVSAEAAIRFAPRFIPWSPRLHEIPADRPEVAFRFFGRLPDGVAADACEAFLMVKGGASVRRPLSLTEPVVLPIPGGARKGLLSVGISRRTGDPIVANDYPFTVVERTTGDTSKHVRLNNLVTVVLKARTPDGRLSRKYPFYLPRRSWTWIKMTAKHPRATFARVDEDSTLDPNLLSEGVFCELEAGQHELMLAPSPSGTIEVRMVPGIINYAPCETNLVLSNPPYDWAYFRKHVMPFSNVQNAGNIPPEHFTEFRAGGGRWLANLKTTGLKDAENVPNLFRTSKAYADPRYDGITCDEQYVAQPVVLDFFTRGLTAFNVENRSPKDIFCWLVGKPSNPGIEESFFAAAVNAAGGRGKVLSEVYCRVQPTEREAAAYIADYVGGTAEACDAVYPDASASMGIVFGNFNQLTRLSINHYPEVDEKYFLDMAVNRLANDPRCAHIAFTGYWGSHDADDEMHRWSFALMRHYCLEGRKDMLSSAYGFTYLPGHLANGDFRTSLGGWETSGDVALDRFAGLGRDYERRWYAAEGVGDAFARMTRRAGSPSRLTQRIVGLVPGKKYVLQFVAFDVRKLRSGIYDPAVVPVGVSFGDGAEIVEALSWNDVRTNFGWNERKRPRVNLRHVVFTAKVPEMVLSLDDAQLPDGAETGLNAVSLRPFYEGD